jgi:transcriptional antiterminator NusG
LQTILCMSENAKWYVIHTYSGYENKAAADIEKTAENRKMEDLIFDVSVPVETVIEVTDNKRKEVERKIFPGYVLVKMILNDDTWFVVRNTRGVTGFVGPSSKPVPLTEKEVEALGVEKRVISVEYNAGDRVKINSGALEGFVGIVDEFDINANQVKVTVSMFGREIPVELELDEVEAVDN